MNGSGETSGPQFRADRPEEQPAVRTTIVGGRPPGSGQGVGTNPRGIEILVKKAAVDPEFRTLLLDERAAAAERIGLTLEAAETAMLQVVPRPQLEGIIDRTRVSQEHRRAFLGNVAAAMLAALGVTAGGCEPPPTGSRPDYPVTTGIAPDMPPVPPEPEKVTPPQPGPPAGARPAGIQPDLPVPAEAPAEARDLPPVTGSRP